MSTESQNRPGPPTRYVKEPSGIRHLLGKRVLVTTYAFGLHAQYAGKLTQIKPPATVGGKGAGLVLDRAWCQEPGKKSRFCGGATLPWSQVYNVAPLDE